jgi:hypothetical protein
MGREEDRDTGGDKKKDRDISMGYQTQGTTF